MNLFERVPPRLFSVLASPGRAVYAHILFILYDLFRRMPVGIPREIVVDAAAAYLETLSPEAVEEAAADARGRALAVLRRLKEDGWIDLEVRSNYDEFITLADYAGQLLATLDRIRTQRPTDYAGFVYATYAALSVEDVERQGAIALEKAYDQTEQLIRELKLLHHNIRRYTERLLQQQSPRAILAMHFMEYKDQVLDRSYHQLRTADHVSKYRPRILQRVQEWLLEPGRVERVAAEESRRRGTPPEAAEPVVRERLQFIQSAYLGMDELLEEIDRRNAQYAKASLEQIRYLLSSTKDTEGQLAELLAFAASQLSSGEWRADEPLPEQWQRLAHLYPVLTLEPGSLYKPRERRTHQPAPLEAAAVSPAERALARLRARERLAARLTAQRIEAWVLERMGEADAVRAADLGIADTDSFVRLIYAGALGRSRRLRFSVDYRGEPVSTAGGRYRFKNVTLRRK